MKMRMLLRFGVVLCAGFALAATTACGSWRWRDRDREIEYEHDHDGVHDHDHGPGGPAHPDHPHGGPPGQMKK